MGNEAVSVARYTTSLRVYTYTDTDTTVASQLLYQGTVEPQDPASTYASDDEICEAARQLLGKEPYQSQLPINVNNATASPMLSNWQPISGLDSLDSLSIGVTNMRSRPVSSSSHSTEPDLFTSLIYFISGTPPSRNIQPERTIENRMQVAIDETGTCTVTSMGGDKTIYFPLKSQKNIVLKSTDL